MAFCPNCGTQFDEGTKFCPNCGAQTNANANSNAASKNQRSKAPKKQKKKGGCLKSILIFFAVIIGIGVLLTNTNTQGSSSSGAPTASASNSSQGSIPEKKETTPETIPQPKETTNMPVGTLIKAGDLEIGLSYVKTSGTFTNAMGTNEDVAAGDEVIFAFFEVHNAGTKLIDFSKSKVSAYADSTKLENVPSYMLFSEDGIKEYQSYGLDEGTYAIVPFDFEVKKGWQSVTIFYGNNSWTIDAKDVTNQPFVKDSLFENKSEFHPTELGAITELSKYTLQFDGIEAIPQKYSWSGPWIAFKFTINNTDAKELDMSLVGYKMRGYRNGYLLDDANYTVDDNLNGYVNVFDIDEVKPGMSAKIYVAFDTADTHGQFSMAFDDGYLFHNTACMLYAEN